MPDPHAQKLDWSDELRRRLSARRLRSFRVKLAVVGGIAVLPLAAGLVWRQPLLLLWNASSSSAKGLYRVHSTGSVRRGDMVIAWAPEPARSLAAKRRYVPGAIPLVKRVAAGQGDRVCALRTAISINGRRAAIRRKSDRAGRPMPWWNGCRRLRFGEYFLLTDSPWSFDGRYFGVTGRNDLVGRAELLWAR
jgi:conjugative transfer signal peptidase TraF